MAQDGDEPSPMVASESAEEGSCNGPTLVMATPDEDGVYVSETTYPPEYEVRSEPAAYDGPPADVPGELLRIVKDDESAPGEAEADLVACRRYEMVGACEGAYESAQYSLQDAELTTAIVPNSVLQCTGGVTTATFQSNYTGRAEMLIASSGFDRGWLILRTVD